MAREGQHRARLVVQGDAKSAIAEHNALAKAQDKLEKQVEQANASLGRQGLALDKNAVQQSTAGKASIAAASQRSAAEKSAMQATYAADQARVDSARREQEVSNELGRTRSSSTRERLRLIEQTRVAELRQVDSERLHATTRAKTIELDDRTAEANHRAQLARIRTTSDARAGQAAQMQQFGQKALAIGTAVTIGALAVDQLASRAVRLDGIMQNLPFSIDGARDSTRGFVSDSKLMESAVLANQLGVARSSSAFQKLAADATVVALKTGRDIPEALQRMVQGLGKGEQELLDEFGIVMRAEEAHQKYARQLGKTVGELSAMEKQQAFVNLGLQKISEVADGASSNVEGLAAAWLKAKVATGNAVDSMLRADEVAKDLGVEVLTALGDSTKEASSSMDSLGRATAIYGRAAIGVVSLGGTELMIRGFDALSKTNESANERAREATRIHPALNAIMRGQGGVVERAASAWKLLGESYDLGKMQRDLDGTRIGIELAAIQAGVDQKARDIIAKNRRRGSREDVEEITLQAKRDILAQERQIVEDRARVEQIGLAQRLDSLQTEQDAERALLQHKLDVAKTEGERVRARGDLYRQEQQMVQDRHELELAVLDSEVAAMMAAEQQTRRLEQARLEASVADATRRRELGEAQGGVPRVDLRRKELDAERELLDFRRSKAIEEGEILAIEEEAKAAQHARDMERAAEMRRVEDEELAAARKNAEAKAAIWKQVGSMSKSMAGSVAQSMLSMKFAENAAGKAAAAAGESEWKARARSRGESLVSLSQQLAGQSLAHGVESAAAFATLNFPGGAMHAAAAGILAGGAIAVGLRGRQLMARGGGGGSSGGASLDVGGGSPVATQAGPVVNRDVPPSPNASRPGGSGVRQTGPSAPGRSGGVINIEVKALKADRSIAREIRQSLDDLAMEEAG